MPTRSEQPVLFRQIAAYVEEGITTGKFQSGEPLPSDMQLARKFKTSRPTVVRAMIDLEHRGLVERRAGSGTYMKRSEVAEDGAGMKLGLLAAGLDGTEILNPLCDEVCRHAERRGFTMVRGTTEEGETAQEPDAEAVVSRFVERGVVGVFFAPLERVDNRVSVNQRIVRTLTTAGIAVVLLDRDITEFPERSALDLVGIDNFTGGFLLGVHLAACGYRLVRFVARPHFPSTTNLRMAGLREALIQANRAPARDWARFGEPDDPAFVETLLKGKRPDAIVCSNDRTAALLLQSLTSRGLKIPEDIAVAGFDDVRYASLLSTPLTTLHQPCRDLGRLAVDLMVSRLTDPHIPARSVQLPVKLIVRASTAPDGR